MRRRSGAYAALAAVLVIMLAPAGVAAHGPPLTTALQSAPGADGQLAFARIREAGAQAVRIPVAWSGVAPAGASPPASFEAANPDDPLYRWSYTDQQVEFAAASGLTPIIDLYDAPQWAHAPGATSPDPRELGLFAQAAAARYDGTRPGLPRVRFWEVWNEPNVSLFMAPQVVNGRPVSVDRYRDMVNDVAAAVKGVHADNVVVAGALFPNAVSRPGLTAIAPLAFLRALFCLSAGRVPRSTCRTQVHADVLSVHPYASGSPLDKPANPDDVWIANLASVRALVTAAQRSGSLVSPQPVGLWVTEFGWNTDPPDRSGVPLLLHERWTAEALYRMWQAGVSLATWFQLRDEPTASSIFQSGLYFRCAGGLACDTPKPALAAFRFPFVAYGSSGSVLVWGRTPAGAPGVVLIQRAVGRGWRRLAALRTDGDGIFAGRLRLPRGVNARSGSLRAVLANEASPPFSLTRPRDLLVAPFG
jgi:cellulase (glycosyl hydrolase family 5)